MPNACCDFCYEGFLEEDGSVNYIAFEKVKKSQIDYIESLKTDRDQVRVWELNEKIEQIKQVKEPKCVCVCHVKGSVVFH